ncbi:radical SAM protein [Roseibium sp.]|uniref:radical SAM protein n=1 Tax=Roseibium sp. TaxID=1936156 RepID=UPI00391AB88E
MEAGSNFPNNGGSLHLADNFKAAWNQNHLHLIIMPTEKCNFRCVYCYEDFKIGKMKPDVLSGVKNLIRTRVPTIKSLEINWFGGEPTVALDTVLEVMETAKSVCREHNVYLRAGMTTNGFLLTADAYRALVDNYVVDYQISLDGPAEFHDTTRLQANGKGSFEQIMANLDAIYQLPIEAGEILLRLHLTRKNEYVLNDFAQWLEIRYGQDKRFRFTLQPVENLGGDADLSELVLENQERGWGENSHPVPSDEETSGMERKHDDTYVCYAAKANSFVLRADGRVGKCTVALNNDYNTIGELKPDGSLSLDEAKTARWFRGWSTQNQADLACPAASVFL